MQKVEKVSMEPSDFIFYSKSKHVLQVQMDGKQDGCRCMDCTIVGFVLPVLYIKIPEVLYKNRCIS